MSGKIVSVLILLVALVGGGWLYYLQVYGFYTEVPASDGPDVVLVTQGGDAPEPIEYSDFRAVDADSSPIRYRACFATDMSPATLAGRFEVLEDATPRNAPGWFDCFDAEAIALALSNGTARAFLGQKNVHYGVDRIVVVTDDGRGFVWHDLNDCGQKAYDGTVVGEACPPRPQNGEG